jgi:hypothetical protein
MSNVVEFQYHGSCYDGFGAMWSAKQALETMGDPNLANAEFPTSLSMVKIVQTSKTK